jgi:virulence-associated protein VagC
MDKTRVFRNGGSVAVRLPAKYALPPGEIMIEKKDEKLILTPLDKKGWPVDLEKWFTGAFDDFELPERPKDTRPIDF